MRNSARRLELPALLDLLSNYVSSEPGRLQMARLHLSFDIETSRLRYRETEVMMRLIQSGTVFDFGGIPEIGQTIERIGTGLFIPGKELHRIADFIDAADETYDKITGTDLQFKLPDPAFLRPLVREIRKTIDEEGEVRDNATPELQRLREQKRRQRQEVIRLMDSLMDKYYRQGLVRERVVTIRNGRFVLPFFSHVKPRGVVHGFSQTEETIYVEPFESIDAQNRLIRIEESEREEVERILRDLTSHVHQMADTIKALWEGIGELEVIYARAAFGLDYGGIVPELNTGKRIRLKKARHPLLIHTKGYENVVPLDLSIGPSPSVLLISGPNAGGKTVILKTVGLLTLMAGLGIPITAEEAEIFLPSEVFAVGFEDVQDIEQGESSFTAILHELKELIEFDGGPALILLDEFIASTDPNEGAALAFAILRYLSEKGHLIIANTHLTPLKLMVEKEENMLNATVLFDPVTRKPTYRLKIGEIGSSYALDIARRVGIPEQIVSEAEGVLSGLEKELRELTRRLREKESILARKLAEISEMESKFRQEEEKLRREARIKAKKIMDEARKEAEELVRQLRKELREKRRLEDKLKEARKVRDELKERAEDYLELYKNRAESPRIGEKYRVKPFGFIGELVEIKENRAILKVGKQRIEVPIESLYEV